MENKAFERLFVEACELYESGGRDNEIQAFAIFRELSDSGYAPAHMLAGGCLFYGIGTDEDLVAAYPYLEKATENGNVRAYTLLGVCQYDGIGTEKSLSDAYYSFRLGEEFGDEEAARYLGELEFSEEDKKRYEDVLKDITITDDALEEHIESARNGGASSKYLLAKYYTEKKDYKNALRYAAEARRAGLDVGRCQLVYIIGAYFALTLEFIDAKLKEYEENPVLIDGHEPNAVEVAVFGGGAKPIYIEDFSSYEGLGVPLGCDRINIVSTMGMRYLSRLVGEVVVGYVDAFGQPKELLNNAVMSTISGYHYLAGNCVVCGFEKDYVPLDGARAYAAAAYLNDFDVYYDGRMIEHMIAEKIFEK